MSKGMPRNNNRTVGREGDCREHRYARALERFLLLEDSSSLTEPRDHRVKTYLIHIIHIPVVVRQEIQFCLVYFLHFSKILRTPVSP